MLCRMNISRRSFVTGTIAWTTLVLAGCGQASAPASPSSAAPKPSTAASTSAEAKPSAGTAASAKPSGSAAASAAASPKPSAPGTANAIKGAWVAITANQMLWPLAADAGLFDKYGVNFNLQYVQGSATAVQALLAGDLQMVEVAGSAVVAAQAAKQSLVMTMGFLNQTVWRIMAKPEITSVDQLKGKNIAVTRVGNADYFAWSQLAAKQGWKVEDFKFLNANDAPGQVTMLKTGNADAIALSPPNEIQAQKQAGAHLLLDEATYKIPEQQVGMAISPAYLAQNRATALNVSKASIEAMALWKKDPAKAKAVIGKYLKTEDQEYIDDGYSAYGPL